jgi:signal transduction histidine kinase
VQRALELAREGLQETRRAVGALRGESVSVATSIEALVAEYRDAVAGTDVEVVIDGDVARLHGQIASSLVRIVQEALTNVRKHAPGASVRVTVDAGTGPDGELVAVIEDRGGAPAQPDGLADSGGGYGVLGMRERAEQLGGDLEAGPTADGFKVVLRIPPQKVPR